MAVAADAGDLLQASEFSLPAATTIVTPAVTAAAIASFNVWEKPPPRLMFATHFIPEGHFEATYSMPAMTPELDPDPELLRTLTAHKSQSFATP
mmetsp:Transcript_13684/g.33119  ORF Transcript_13684/g.33119 Transcript_13684/m.33119 type:complete len:94 (-) Transcript_13684:595-876(-)